MQNKTSIIIGLSIIFFLIVSYFIKINVEKGLNYTLEDSLLGIIIFHNPFILGLYILIAGIFIFLGLKQSKHKIKK